jgi:hypothetical protein
MSDREMLRHIHKMLHDLSEGQIEILDAIADVAAAERDNEKLSALRAKIVAKTDALKAALAAAPK